MNASQLVAWFVCLGLALFGSVLAVRNSYKMAVLERRFVSVSDTAAAQSAVLSDIHEVLQNVEKLLRERASHTDLPRSTVQPGNSPAPPPRPDT